MRRAARLFLIAVTLVAGMLVALAALLLAFEFTFSLDRSKEALIAALSRVTEAETRIDGELTLVTGPRPRIQATEVGISRTVGDRRVSSRLRRIGIGLQPLELLRGKLSLADIRIDGESVCVTPGVEGPRQGADAGPRRSESRWYFPEIERITVERLDLIAGRDCAEENKVLQLARLEWTAPATGEPRIAARGDVKGEPWSAELSGALLASPGRGAAPFKLAAELAGVRLVASGRGSLVPPAVNADVGLDSPELARLLTLAGAPFQGFGPLSVRGRIEAEASRVEVHLDEARVQPGVFAGDFSLLRSKPRPRIGVHVRSPGLAAFAVERWLMASLEFEDAKQEGLPGWLTATARDTEGELSLDVVRLTAGEVSLGALNYQGRWQDGKLAGTLTGNLRDRPIDGALSLDASTDVATISSSWSIGAITLPAELGVTGTIGRLEASASARAGPGETLAESLRMTLSAKDVRLLIRRDKRKPFALPLRSARAEWGAQETLRLEASGALLGEPASVRIEGPDARTLLRGESWRMKSSGNLAQLRFTANGEVALPEEGARLDLEVSAGASRLGALASGFDAIASLPAALSGRVSRAEGRWTASVASMRLGKSRGRGELVLHESPASQPLEAKIALDVLDVAELAGTPRTDQERDRELLPASLALPDANLTLDVARLTLPDGITPRLGLSATTRGGHLEIAPLKLALDGGGVDGSLKADLRAAKPGLSAALQFRAIEGRHFERWLKGTGWDFEAGDGDLEISTSGRRFSEWAANADYRLQTRDLRLTTSNGKTRSSADLSRVALSAAPGKPAMLSAEGTVAGRPLNFQANFERLDRLLIGGETPFSLTGKFAGLDVRMQGALPLEFEKGKRLAVHAAADRLDTLNSLLDADFPPVGPLALDADLTQGQRALTADVRIAFGESRAAGQVSRQAGARPSYAVNLTAPLVRVEDLGLRHWIDKAESEVAGQPPKATPAKGSQRSAADEKVAEVVRGFDARVGFKAERVTAQGSLLGSGELEATLKSGHLSVPRIRIQTPEGDLSGSVDADFSPEPPRFRAQANLPRFRYGPLLKSIEPASDDQGELSLKFDLSASAPADDIVRHLNGEFDLLVFPTGRRVMFLDLLGGDVLRSLTSAFDSDGTSKLNCAVASLNIRDGLARSDTVLLDATRVRAAGELEVNLETQALKGLLAPRSKRPALFTTEVALQIGGTLREPKIAPAPAEVAVAAARNIYFAYSFLYDVLSKRNIPEDGSEECRAIYQRVSQ